MNKRFFILLFLASLTAYGQMQERVAIINTLDDRDSVNVSELAYLTDKLRETAVKILPKDRFGVMTTESIVAFLGSMENTVKVCKAASCLAELGRMVSADFVAQGRVGRFGKDLTIRVELYNVKTGNLIGSFAGDSKDIYGLRDIINENATALFKQMLYESKPQKKEPELVVEKPELVKLEPEPMKQVLEKPKEDKSSFKTSFWIALGLDVVGAVIIYNGYASNEKAQEKYDEYKSRNYNGNAWEAGDDWDKVESNQRSRNMFYVIGGVFLTSGIGLHIWF